MNEHKDPNTDNNIYNEKKERNRLAGNLISIILIVTVALGVFILINNRLSTGRAIEAGSQFDRSTASCCRGSSAPVSSENNLAAKALDYYRNNYGSTAGLQARVEDFGCHQEISISRNNQQIKRFGYSGDSFYDLTP